MKIVKIISVDLQKDFADPKGKHFKPRPSVEFVKNILVPFLREKNIKIFEIISDYRMPRLEGKRDSCHPGEWGYESEIPEDVKDKNIWVKCMNSPEWIRDGIGDKNKTPGLPYPDPKKYDEWLIKTIGKPEDNKIIVLIGLTLDCCVLSTAQTLNFRGYKVYVLNEAVDVYSGDQKEKEYLLNHVPIKNWASPISFEEFKKLV
jgi:nicotinamidase-related amidase